MKQNLEEFKRELVDKFNEAFVGLEERYKNKKIEETIVKMLKSARVEINVIFQEHPDTIRMENAENRIKEVARKISKGQNET